MTTEYELMVELDDMGYNKLAEYVRLNKWNASSLAELMALTRRAQPEEESQCVCGKPFSVCESEHYDHRRKENQRETKV